MKWLIFVAGTAILALSLFYLVNVVRGGFGDLPAIHWTPTALASAGLSILIYVAAVIIWSGGWAILLTAVGQPVGIVMGFTIIGISQITKYLPGNFAHHIGRVALAKRFGLGSGGVVLSMTLEVFWVLAAAMACTIFAALIASPQGTAIIEPIGLAALAALFFGAIAVPVGGLAAARMWGGRLLRRQGLDMRLHVPNVPQSALVLLYHIATYLLQGAILVLIAQGVFGLAFTDYWLGVGVFALAFVAGFAVPGVPAGLGVREAVLIAGLSLEMSAGSAIALATAHRIVNVVGDGVIFALAMAARRYFPPASPAQ